jgi:integrase/recombinase XerD
MNIPKYIESYRKELTLKNYSENTIENYSSQVFIFLKNFNNSYTEPIKITEKQIKEWLLEAKTINSRKHRISAIKLFYNYVIKQPLKFKNIEYPRKEEKLPVILSIEEIQKMFNVCTNLKHKVTLSILYSTGIRVSELIELKWVDIDRSRMLIRIRQAKGNKDRFVPLSNDLIILLEKYYKEYRSKEFILNGQTELKYSGRSVLQVIKQLSSKAKITKRVYTHLIRHCSFSHLYESGVDMNILQKLAGHSSMKTTQIYTKISSKMISKINSPLNNININI